MGGVANCASSEKYKYVHLRIEDTEEVRICNIGVFTCPCSNYIGYRTGSTAISLPFDFTGTDAETINTSKTI